MKHLVALVALSAAVTLWVHTAWAQPPKGGSGRSGFAFGGAPEFDRPPLPKDDERSRPWRPSTK